MAKGITLNNNTVEAQDDALLYNAFSGRTGVFSWRSGMGSTVVSANDIRISDGLALVQGRLFAIYANEAVDVTISNGSQGMKRNDIIVIEFSKEGGTETMVLKCIQGTESEDNPIDPELIQEDTLASGTTYQMPLWRVCLDGINVEALEDMRTFIPSGSETAQGAMFYLAEGTGYINVGNYSEWLASGSPKFGSDVSTASAHASTSSLDEEAMDDSQHLDAEGKENDDENNE